MPVSVTQGYRLTEDLWPWSWAVGNTGPAKLCESGRMRREKSYWVLTILDQTEHTSLLLIVHWLELVTWLKPNFKGSVLCREICIKEHCLSHTLNIRQETIKINDLSTQLKKLEKIILSSKKKFIIKIETNSLRTIY